MSQTFQLTSAKLMGDGLILRMQYEAGVSVGQALLNRLTDTGIADYLPGVNAGLSVTVNGTSAEVIGLQSEDWNMPLPWMEVPTNDGSLAAGTYIFLIAIQDASGNEVYVGRPIIGYMGDSAEQGTYISANQAITFHWRQPVPVGGRVNIYACTAIPVYSNLQRVASVPYASLSSPTKYKLTVFGSDNAAFTPKSVAWTVTCLLSSPTPMGATVTVSAPASLIVDEKSNATAEVSLFKATNNSVVGTNGFLATSENVTATSGSFSFARTVYVSYSRGANAVGNGTLASPYQTVSYAMSQTASGTNIRFRLLRGDTFPADIWIRAYWGTSVFTPSLFESYWNPNYGADPGTRPIVTVGDPYFDMVTKDLDKTYLIFQNAVDSTNSTSGNGDRPYIYFRGLAFRADPDYPCPRSDGMWPSCTAEDFVVISDCEFQNVCLVGTYGVPQKNAPVGCMVHRTVIHSVHGSQLQTYPDTGSTGTSLILPDRYVNPWAGYASSGSNVIVPGQTYVSFFNQVSRWKLANWKVTAKEGSLSETKTLTGHADGSGSKWNVDTPWTNSFTRSGVSISLDPTGQQFQILKGTGFGSTTYTITAYNATTRTATVSPSLPTVDSTSRIAFLPLAAWDMGGHLQGIYLAHCGDWLIAQTHFDKNGWNWSDDTATHNDIYNHNGYLSAMCTDVVTHGNYFLRANSVGLQQRGGGVCSYNIFAENTHGSNMLNGGTVYKNLYTGQGLYNFSLSTPPSHLPGVLHDFNIVLKSHGSLENRIPTANYTGITALNCSEYTYSHSYFAVRHGTFVDAGSINLGLRLPVPNKLQVHNNIIANRTTTGVDYQGTPLQSSYLSLQTNWQANGLQSVTPTISNQVDWDYNAHRIANQNAAFQWPDTTTKSFATWQSKGRDTHGISMGSDPTFTNGSYGLSDWASANGVGSSFDSIWQNLRARQEGVWSDFYDGANCYRAFANAYKPDNINVPAIDSSILGYYGVVDNRSSVSPVTYSLAASAVTCYVGDTVTFTVTPSVTSNDTLTVATTSGTLSNSTLAWSSSGLAKIFTVTPTVSGLFSVSLYLSGSRVSGPMLITVNQVVATSSANYRLLRSRGSKMFRQSHD